MNYNENLEKCASKPVEWQGLEKDAFAPGAILGRTIPKAFTAVKNGFRGIFGATTHGYKKRGIGGALDGLINVGGKNFNKAMNSTAATKAGNVVAASNIASTAKDMISSPFKKKEEDNNSSPYSY